MDHIEIKLDKYDSRTITDINTAIRVAKTRYKGSDRLTPLDCYTAVDGIVVVFGIVPKPKEFLRDSMIRRARTFPHAN
jgi:hypothetical protein